MATQEVQVNEEKEEGEANGEKKEEEKKEEKKEEEKKEEKKEGETDKKEDKKDSETVGVQNTCMRVCVFQVSGLLTYTLLNRCLLCKLEERTV